jgi:hypothetical protein
MLRLNWKSARGFVPSGFAAVKQAAIRSPLRTSDGALASSVASELRPLRQAPEPNVSSSTASDSKRRPHTTSYLAIGPGKISVRWDSKPHRHLVQGLHGARSQKSKGSVARSCEGIGEEPNIESGSKPIPVCAGLLPSGIAKTIYLRR